MAQNEHYPVNLIEHLTRPEKTELELQRERHQNGERHVDFQSPEMLAIGSLEQYCIPKLVNDIEKKASGQ